MKKCMYPLLACIIGMPTISQSAFDRKTAHDTAVSDMTSAHDILQSTYELVDLAIELLSRLNPGLTSSEMENAVKDSFLTRINEKIAEIKAAVSTENGKAIKPYVATQFARVINMYGDPSKLRWPGAPSKDELKKSIDTLKKLQDEYEMIEKTHEPEPVVEHGGLLGASEHFRKQATQARQQAEKRAKKTTK